METISRTKFLAGLAAPKSAGDVIAERFTRPRLVLRKFGTELIRAEPPKPTPPIRKRG